MLATHETAPPSTALAGQDAARPGPDAIWAALGDPSVVGRLQNVTRRIALTPPDAEDAFQDAVVQALSHADSFRSDALVSTWLHRIVVNSALMGRRRSAVWIRRTTFLRGDGRLRQGGDGGDGEASGGGPELPDAAPSPEQLVQAEEERQRLRRAIEQLPARSRHTITALLADERPADAPGSSLAAEESGSTDGDEDSSGLPPGASSSPETVSSNALRARMSRARNRLKDLMGAMDLSVPRPV
jgi:RNA polymerase sigma factor (sigma-70 family)